MDKLISYIKTLLTQEEIERDSNNYFIRSHAILQKRKTSDYDLNELSEFVKEKNKEKENEKLKDEELAFDCEDEKIILIYKRWIKLYQDFFNKKKNRFDISKIPDVYDNIKYDLIHNKTILNDDAYNLYYCISHLANFVMPLEYGITVEEKIKIGYKVLLTLLRLFNLY
jgi:inositol hexakisphosphate/diphosphoinositol-pentakisphosphate kinase